MVLLELLTPESLIALLTLTALEIVLGIDNIVFLVLITGRLAPEQQAVARRSGLVAAMAMRILLLLGISWIMGLVRPLFALLGHVFTGRDLIMLGGGLFLIAKATYEIHHRLEDGRAEAAEGDGKRPRHLGFGAALVQIMLLDIVFSLDSVITAVGMAQHVAIMITAVTIAIVVMLVFANKISQFVEKHPTVKMLALAFLLLVGVMLVAEGFGRHIEKGYIYFAMAFSLVVELLNQRASAGARRRREADPPPASSPAGPANGEAGRASASSGSASAGTVALAREPRGRQQESTPPATRSPRPRTGQPSRPR